ncbi:MAG: NAD-dependent epimerase/dehydratase family protein [Calditrichaeota bacterium]|nr:MAG: NAD-dependent epimerase/dehydratase family protein [Calditrichota bacterium]
MNILVTGGAGFIGSHIVDAYLREGHTVTIIDDLSSGRKENINPQATFYKMDIQEEAVADIFARHQFDVVNHQAAQMDVRKSVADPIFDARVNVLGMLNLLQNCVHFGVKKFIFASTGGAVYGEQSYFPADEEHPTWPLSPYGITKLTGEKYLYFYKQVHHLNHVILRYANVYGPRQNPHGEAGVVAIFSTRLLLGEQPVINGDGKQTRDYVYVGDVVRANLLALNYEKSDIFNIGTGTETDVNTIFQRLNELTGARAEEYHGPPKPGEQLRSCISYKKAEKILGWRPEIDLNQGLRLTVQFFKEHLTNKK